MGSSRWALLAWLGLAVTVAADGVVVEEIAEGSAPQQTELRRGDVLLGWARGDIQLTSTLDFAEVAGRAPAGVLTQNNPTNWPLKAVCPCDVLRARGN